MRIPRVMRMTPRLSTAGVSAASVEKSYGGLSRLSKSAHRDAGWACSNVNFLRPSPLVARQRILSLHEFARSMIQRTEAVAARGARKRKFARLYLDPALVRRIKRMAIKLGCQPHDLFVEGVDLMMRKYGQPSAADRRQEMAGLGKNRPTKRIVTP